VHAWQLQPLAEEEEAAAQGLQVPLCLLTAGGLHQLGGVQVLAEAG
jgi:hypothetical protein